MRRVFVLGAALGMMWAVERLRMDGVQASPDPLTLAAIGFVVLAAFTVGELGGALKLPKVTGYIVSGVLLGPQVSDVLSSQVVKEMATFNTLALGLIATTAGLELDLSAIRKVFRTLAVTVAAKVPLLLLMVGGAFYVTEATFGFLGLQDSAAILALALVFAVLGIGTSPAIALAVVNETGAKGRLSDLVLAIAVVKDLVVVVCLALALAVARVLVLPDAPLSADVLVRVAEELAVSIAVGAAVGGLLIVYMRFVKAEMLVAVLVAILLTAEVSRTFHLELLLVFIAAGFVVRNFSSYEHELLHSLERIALPVFVVFFTTAGAGVDLRGTVALLPLALVVAGGRAGAYFIASRLGAQVGREAAPVAKNAWYAYLPQAGVTLGLVFLAQDALPELGPEIRKTGLAVVALHLLLGPVLLGVALRRAGEVPNGAAPAEAPATDAPGPAPARVAPPEPAPALVLVPPDRAALAAAVGVPELVGLAEDVRQTLEDEAARFLADVARPRTAAARRYAEGIFEAPDAGESVVMAIHRRLPKDRPDLVGDWGPTVQRLEEAIRTRVHALPATVAVPMAEALVAWAPEDGVAVRARKTAVRVAGAVRLRQGRVRDVPVRLLGRLACEAKIADAAVVLAGAWPRAYAAMLDQVRMVATEERTAEAALAEVDAIAGRFEELSRRTLDQASAEILNALAATLPRAGSPALPLASLRFSRVEPEARAARQRLEREVIAWRRVTDAAFDTVRARTAVLAFGEVLSEILDQRVRGPLEVVAEQLVPVVGHIRSRLETAEAELEGEEVSAAKMGRALGLARSAYPKADRTKVRRARARFRRGAQPHLLVSELSRVIEGVPTELILLPPGMVLDAQGRVEAVPTLHLDFGRRAEGVLLERLVPRLIEELDPISDLVAVSDLRFDEVVQMAVYGVELAAQQDAPLDGEQVKQFRAALERARGEAEALERAFTEGLERARAAVEGEGAQAGADLAAILGADGGAGTRVRSQVRATRRAIRQTVEAAWRQLRGAARWALRRLPVEGLFGADRVRRAAHLDAAAVRAQLDASCQTQVDLPPLYEKLFSLQPAEDLRLAVAHKDVVEGVSRRVGQRGAPGARVLVVGEHGSGRTTFLNALELRHQRQRTLRLDAIFHLRNEGLVSALAAELGSVDDDRAVVSALNERPTLVLVDDLERHVTASEAGARELERFAAIVVETQATTGWVVTSTPAGLAALEALGPVGAPFAHRVALGPLDPEQAQAAVEARARLAGTRVSLPRPRRWLGLGLGRRTPESEFYRELVQSADGNLRAILQGYLRTLHVDGDGELAATRPERVVLPFVAQLEAEALAILGLLLRFGPHDAAELARVLWMDPATARLFALNLEAGGLLERLGGSSQELFYISPAVEHPLGRALVRAGILPREGAA